LDGNRRLSPARARCTAALALVAAAAALSAPAASADDSSPDPPSGSSAVDVYRESVPTSSGPRVVDSSVARTVRLGVTVERRLRREGGRDTPTLERIATSSELGAPARRLVPGMARQSSSLPAGWAPSGLLQAGRDVLGLRAVVLAVVLAAGSVWAIVARRRRV
jgi:hypothetical protein